MRTSQSSLAYSETYVATSWSAVPSGSSAFQLAGFYAPESLITPLAGLAGGWRPKPPGGSLTFQPIQRDLRYMIEMTTDERRKETRFRSRGPVRLVVAAASRFPEQSMTCPNSVSRPR